jgi:hypothetical protein
MLLIFFYVLLFLKPLFTQFVGVRIQIYPPVFQNAWQTYGKKRGYVKKKLKKNEQVVLKKGGNSKKLIFFFF